MKEKECFMPKLKTAHPAGYFPFTAMAKGMAVSDGAVRTAGMYGCNLLMVIG
jgi:hypothetical protein